MQRAWRAPHLLISLIPEVLKQLSSLPKDWVLSTVFMIEHKATPEWGKCKGDTCRFVEKHNIRSLGLTFIRRQHGILYGKRFIEPNNLHLTKACSKKLKPATATFERWVQLAEGTSDKKVHGFPGFQHFKLSLNVWKTGINQTEVIWLNSKQGEVPHSLYYTGWPNQQNNLVRHLTLQIPPAYPTTKATNKRVQCSRQDNGTAWGLILHLTRSMSIFVIEFNVSRNDAKIFPVQMSAINLDDGYLIPKKASGIKLKRQRYIHIFLNWETPQLSDNLN